MNPGHCYWLVVSKLRGVPNLKFSNCNSACERSLRRTRICPNWLARTIENLGLVPAQVFHLIYGSSWLSYQNLPGQTLDWTIAPWMEQILGAKSLKLEGVIYEMITCSGHHHDWKFITFGQHGKIHSAYHKSSCKNSFLTTYMMEWPNAKSPLNDATQSYHTHNTIFHYRIFLLKMKSTPEFNKF